MNNLVNKRLLMLVLSSVAAFLLVFGVAYAMNRQNDKNKEQYSSESQAPAPLTEDYITVLLAGVDDTQMLTDVIMIGRYDVKNNKVNVLQVPRDCFIGDEYKTGKINAVYGHPREGEKKIETLKRELESRLKINIDYYGIVTLEGLRTLVDDLGGIEIEIPKVFENLKNSILKPGIQTIDGKQAEWLIRYREGYKTADIGRINTQELFMRAVFDTVKSKSTYELSKIMMNNFSHFDTDVPMGKAMGVSNQAVNLTNDDINMFVIPGNGKMNRSYAVYEVNKEGLAEILNEHFVLAEEKLTADDMDFPRVTYIPPPVVTPEDENASSEGENYEAADDISESSEPTSSSDMNTNQSELEQENN